MQSVVLLSGGIDSATCLALAVEAGSPSQTLGLSLSYGQKHSLEVEHAGQIARHYGVEHRIIETPRLFSSTTSTLIRGGADNPVVGYDDLDEGVSPAYVPFRNGVFLSIATAVAMEVEATTVYFGAHAEDAQRWAYPDCTPEFIGSMASAMFVGSYMKVRLTSPLQWLTKSEIVALGTRIGVPYQLTMSCYNGSDPACGMCPTCRSRRDAFRAKGLDDPIAYAEDQ